MNITHPETQTITQQYINIPRQIDIELSMSRNLCSCDSRPRTDVDIIKIFVMASSELSLGAFRAMVSLRTEMTVLGEAKDLTSFRAHPTGVRPDILVVWLNDALQENIETINEARRHFFYCPTLLVVRSPSPSGAQRALAAKFTGVLSEDVSVEALMESITSVKSEQCVVGADIATLVSVAAPNPFTPREREILGRAAEGESPEESARYLHLSAGTVRNHLLSAVQKAGARNRIDAVRIARRQGWL
ncbi:helix-turn-helix transcriptional regulator [Streptomyces sp. CA2R101]|uniref:helix-turn-helix transcriptional regulator n=1 Tax=Streptomyces sp. CA2R101 TaxID=3120152 RepID=UPI00300AC0CD